MPRHIPPAPPFDVAEYEMRIDALRRALREAEIDVLLVTAPVNLCYLTGYVASWYAPRLPVGVLVSAHVPELVVVDWSRHADYVPLIALHDEVLLVDYGTAAEELVEGLARRGWAEGRIGLEWSAPNPVAGVLRDIAGGLARLGADVVSGDYLVDDLRVYKSAAELDRIRRAGGMLDEAFEELRTRLRPGMTELEVSALITTLLAERGSEVPAQHALVSSGPTAWADVHAFPSRRVIQRGEVVSVDACAVVDRYHANLSRAFVVDGENPRAEELLAAGAASLAVLCREARLGESPAPAMAAAERALRARVAPENVWWVGGYGLGIAFPPSWVGHTYLADDGPRRAVLRPGYVSNFETVLYDRTAGFEAAAIDTVVATEAGLAPLSRVPRELLHT
ncbi:M24 family metallopeptidase [Microbacterium sp. SORGH_AS_0888]|uniref:M24 family metallopeptidase n=1 Tax=Microbacterium sp. SORGH_AS_0888 TaxID=3041791 RepID=UPI0027887329|nr:M24 family metallopeptidase [Microbacterium sp. SORGH_AS_0888]MDQ1129301.1 Xaa-Pro aminopeptidase [Microbacterium sp. SORGH_AS_0888]